MIIHVMIKWNCSVGRRTLDHMQSSCLRGTRFIVIICIFLLQEVVDIGLIDTCNWVVNIAFCSHVPDWSAVAQIKVLSECVL